MWSIAGTSLCFRTQGEKNGQSVKFLSVLTFPFDEVFNLGFSQPPLGYFFGVEDHAAEALVGHGVAVDGDLAGDVEGGSLSKFFCYFFEGLGRLG